MPLASHSLAFKQAFSNVDIETSARGKLDEAATEYYKAELAKSAKLFLKSWRILRSKYQGRIYKRLDHSLPVKEQMQRERSVAREIKGRLLLSFVALHDLARACSRVDEEYKDKNGKCKLGAFALRYDWKGNTTSEVLKNEQDDDKENDGIKSPCPEGLGITQVLLLKDPLGCLLEEADSFKEAAILIANICSLQIASVSEPLKEHKDGCDFINDSLLWMRRGTSSEIPSIKAASHKMQEKTKKNSEDDEDKGTRKKLVLQMKDCESEEKPPDKKDDKELGLSDQLHVTSLSEQLIHQLERFHFTDRAGFWSYKGKSFEHIQEQKDDSDEEEKRSLLRGGLI